MFGDFGKKEPDLEIACAEIWENLDKDKITVEAMKQRRDFCLEAMQSSERALQAVFRKATPLLCTDLGLIAVTFSGLSYLKGDPAANQLLRAFLEVAFLSITLSALFAIFTLMTNPVSVKQHGADGDVTPEAFNLDTRYAYLYEALTFKQATRRIDKKLAIANQNIWTAHTILLLTPGVILIVYLPATFQFGEIFFTALLTIALFALVYVFRRGTPLRSDE